MYHYFVLHYNTFSLRNVSDACVNTIRTFFSNKRFQTRGIICRVTFNPIKEKSPRYKWRNHCCPIIFYGLNDLLFRIQFRIIAFYKCRTVKKTSKVERSLRRLLRYHNHIFRICPDRRGLIKIQVKNRYCSSIAGIAVFFVAINLWPTIPDTVAQHSVRIWARGSRRSLIRSSVDITWNTRGTESACAWNAGTSADVLLDDTHAGSLQTQLERGGGQIARFALANSDRGIFIPYCV